MKEFKFNYSRVVLATLLATLVVMLPDLAHAAPPLDSFGGKLCEVIKGIKGKVGIAIATFAIITMGIGAFFGKLGWGFVIMVIFAIVSLFAAVEIAGFLANDATNANACAGGTTPTTTTPAGP